MNVDAYEVIRLANTHPRVNILWPGCGVGGPCLTKDPYMLVETVKDVLGVDLISIARRIDEYMPYPTIKLIEKSLKRNNISIEKAKITVLGATYKGGVDDVRKVLQNYS